MPVYASTPGFADRGRHPHALMLIVGGHAILIAAVMSAKMEIIPPLGPTRTIIDFIELPKPPPPEAKPVPQPKTPAQTRNSRVDQPKTVIPNLQTDDAPFDQQSLPPISDTGRIGTGTETLPPLPKIDPVMVGPRFATPERLIKPPYPIDKQRAEEEATLRLKLYIDERGRVTAVEPVGSVDRTFFEAARKHLIANWRYRPATQDGRPVATSTIITLTFRLA